MASPLFLLDDARDRGRQRFREVMSIRDKVEQIVDIALQPPPLSRCMQEFLDSYPHFSHVISRYIRILSQRSPDFSEGEMTIFDKALIAVTQEGMDVESSASILFYCEKWLGYDPASGVPNEAMHDVAQIADLPWERTSTSHMP
jgi:hypothetical protein